MKHFSQHTHCRAQFQTRVTMTTIDDGPGWFVLASISIGPVCCEMENDNIWNSTSGKIGKTIRGRNFPYRTPVSCTTHVKGEQMEAYKYPPSCLKR